MRFKVRYNPEFILDLTDSVAWYHGKQPGLGDLFYTKVKQQTKNLSVKALHFAIRYFDVRCMAIERFPYLVHYRVNESSRTVYVEALLHTSRNPGIWSNRIARY